MQERQAANGVHKGVVRKVGGGIDGSASAYGALASLAGDGLAERYCAWRGASDRRYVASIFPVDPLAFDGGLPAFESFVLIAVARLGSGRRILLIRAIERAGDAMAAIRHGLAERASEWHVHLLAETPAARAAVAADLATRHLSGAPALGARLRLVS